MHVGTILEDFPTLILGPNHEGVHGALNVGLVVFVLARLPDDLGTKNASFCNEQRSKV